ncbi:class I SAM-dependent methyltransferase [Ornithinimicrobium avium]|uniref:SAM-dependent methyltransferase n=1 Tax=Ornithinimicrobium avium TaxID=2283195 RepID=A0A345NJH3_9MICO|nr:SAM-dependent methyltransferase [Ornithinimicrobium avium]AXH95181.1 SAM-dependent methyltransferase [Ornithinimicrobium avium]
MDCCGSGYDEVFTERQARWLRRRYEKRGLGEPGRTMVDLVAARGLDGATVLEIGGGVGELHVELLRRGAARASSVELTSSWGAEARRLLRDHQLEGRVTRAVGDLVQDPGLAGEADVVVLNRVVCCYPDVVSLLAAAGSRAGRTLAFSYPPRNAVVRVGLAVVNGWQRFKGRDYRAFAHPPGMMHEVLEQAGLRPVVRTRSGVWTVSVLERADALERAA